MNTRQGIHKVHAKTLDTQQLREEFLVESIFEADSYTMTYSHIDRILFGGVMPHQEKVSFDGIGKDFGVDYLLERREMGIINIGGLGYVDVDGEVYELENQQALYIGKGAKSVSFGSESESQPAKFYYNSAPAHVAYPTRKITQADACARLATSESEILTLREWRQRDRLKSLWRTNWKLGTKRLALLPDGFPVSQ